MTALPPLENFSVRVRAGDALGVLPSLCGKVILITEAGSRFADGGGATGPGEALAVLAAQAGADLVLVDREPARLAATRARIAEAGRRVVTVVADLSDPAAAAGTLSACRATFGRLDALVGHLAPGAAGTAPPRRRSGSAAPHRARVSAGRSGTGPWNGWDETPPPPGLSPAALMRLARLATEPMRRRGGGLLLNFACAPPERQRQAQEAAARFNRLLTAELGWQGIRGHAVTTLAPGPDVPLPESFGTWLRTRNAAIWHAARGALYLASDQTRTLSGSVLTPRDPVPFAL